MPKQLSVSGKFHGINAPFFRQKIKDKMNLKTIKMKVDLEVLCYDKCHISQIKCMKTQDK